MFTVFTSSLDAASGLCLLLRRLRVLVSSRLGRKGSAAIRCACDAVNGKWALDCPNVVDGDAGRYAVPWRASARYTRVKRGLWPGASCCPGKHSADTMTSNTSLLVAGAPAPEQAACRARVQSARLQRESSRLPGQALLVRCTGQASARRELHPAPSVFAWWMGQVQSLQACKVAPH